MPAQPRDNRPRSTLLSALALTLVTLISGTLCPRVCRADGIDDFNNGWAGRSLASQRLLDLRAPLVDANIVGAHNSFNSGAYTSATSYLDPNQIDSIYNQLRMGARAVEFDVHWTAKSEGPFSFPDRLLLCHGTGGHIGCSLTDRYFAEGLDEISAWLGTSASIGQVLLLHIEDHMDGHHGEAHAEIQARIGSRVYSSGGCGDIPGNLTKADVLAAGRNVVIWNEGGCSGDGNWNSMVFTGLGGLSRVWEDSTTIGGIGGSGASISDGDVVNYFAGGTNIVDLDQLHQNDSRLAAAVWSWDVNEPNNFGGDEDCAVQTGNGRWNDDNCDVVRVFACKNTVTGGWAVSAVAGGWGIGALACDGLGPDYEFGLPTNSRDNQILKQAKNGAGQATAWLNHDDRGQEGVWVVDDVDGIFFGAGGFGLSAEQATTGVSRMLRMEPNCNLVLYSVLDGVIGGGLWTTGTANAGSNCHVDFQGDGNFVLYDGGGGPLWSSSTSGAELWIQNDGNVVIYDGAGGALWQTHTHYLSDHVVDADQLLLMAGQIVHSQNRKLEMQADCNLVLYSFENGVTGGSVWQSDTGGAGANCYAHFQADGNFVVYDGNDQPQWATGTSGTSGAQLRLQSDGNLVVYNGANEPLWTSHTKIPTESIQNAGAFLLSAGQFIQTENRKLEMLPDCNLALSSVANAVVGGALWRSDTAGAGQGCYADFQADGNFVVYDDAATPLWFSGTSGTSGGQLRLQEDGNLVLYNGSNEPLWTANTARLTERIFFAGSLALTAGQFVQHETRKLEMQSDCNLVLSLVSNAVPGASIWHSNTAGAGEDCYLDFQADGNLVVHNGAGQPLWASGTSGTTGAELRLQDDGNVVIYNGAGQPLWATLTPGDFSGSPRCGDATCNGYEDCAACPGDCGECPPVCGDLGCNGAETCSTCPGDCGECPPVCGDSECNGAETCSTCSGDCGVCPPAPCPAVLTSSGCVTAALAKIQIDEAKPGKERMKLQWKKLQAATSPFDFGDPVDGSDAVSICLYGDAGALVQRYTIDRGGAECAGRACWRVAGSKGYRYGDKDLSADGIGRLSLVTGPSGSGKLDVRGGNDAARGATFLPTGVAATLRFQVTPTIQVVTDNGFCVTAEMTDVQRNDGGRYSAKGKSSSTRFAKRLVREKSAP